MVGVVFGNIDSAIGGDTGVADTLMGADSGTGGLVVSGDCQFSSCGRYSITCGANSSADSHSSTSVPQSFKTNRPPDIPNFSSAVRKTNRVMIRIQCF